MALPSLHVACGYAGGDGQTNTPLAHQPIMRDIIWTEAPNSGTPTSNTAKDSDGARALFRLTPTIDVYVSIGPSPDANQNPRLLLRASDGAQDFYAKNGDKLAWIAAV